MTRLQEAIDSLDESQSRAFNVAGHSAVLAPPGSGKTRLLVTRLAHDLERTIAAPRGAACITLTNDAASEVHDRFGELSGDNRTNLFVGTVHAFALTRIIRPLAAAVGQPALATARIVRGDALSTLWDEAVEEVGVPSDEQNLLFGTVDRFRKLMAPEEVWATLGNYPVRVRDAFLNNMDRHGLLDFGRVVEKAVEFVEGSDGARAALRAQFASIYVDEYQDLAPGLDRIVRSLAFGNGDNQSTLFAVGDVDQAIYGWTGTNPALLRNLAGDSRVTVTHLETNYRSGSTIVEVSRRLYGGASIPGSVREGGDIRVVRVAGSIEGQADWIAQSVHAHAAAGVDLEEIGVLCRTNGIGAVVASRLAAAGVPAWFRTNEPWETPTSMLLERLCAWAAHGHEASGQNVIHITGELRRSNPGLESSSVGVSLAAAVNADATAPALPFIQSLIDQMSARGTEEAVAELIEETEGMLESLTSGSLAGASIADLGARRVTAGKVFITTLTSSKGLEFDHVYVLDLEDGRIPFFTSFDRPDELAEERNKFYVAITRARYSVTLLWSGFTITKYGKRDNPVSRFVTELNL
jgi:DNA helicase-2/ATP-dependent DNA helicase PcrA